MSKFLCEMMWKKEPAYLTGVVDEVV